MNAKRNTAIVMMAFIMMMGLAPVQSVFAGEGTVAIADHLALANSYEQKAAEQDAAIGHHQKMKKNYEKRFHVMKKANAPSKVKEMEKHCDAIIQSAEALRNEYADFAKWHRMRAAELQGM